MSQETCLNGVFLPTLQVRDVGGFFARKIGCGDLLWVAAAFLLFETMKDNLRCSDGRDKQNEIILAEMPGSDDVLHCTPAIIIGFRNPEPAHQSPSVG